MPGEPASGNISFSDEGSVPNNSVCLGGYSAPNNSMVVPPRDELNEQLSQLALYNCFESPPSSSTDTSAAERCHRDLCEGAAKTVPWARIARLLKPGDAIAFKDLHPPTAALDIEKFMAFVDAVAVAKAKQPKQQA